MNTHELRERAENYYKSGRLHEALDAYANLCSETPSDAQAWHMQAAINGMLGQYQNAADCCEKAIALVPDSPAIYTNYASALIELSRQDDALIALEKSVKIDPGDTNTNIMLGKLYFLRENHNKAEIHFRKAIDSSPDDAEATSCLAHLLMGSGNFYESASICEQTIPRNPDNIQLLLVLIEGLLASGELNKCCQTIEKANRRFDTLVGYIVKIVRRMHADKKYTDTIAATKMLIGIFPEEYRLYLILSDSLIKTGNNAEAIATIKDYKHAPPTYDALILLANAYNNNDDIDNAISSLLDASRTAPDKVEPVALLSQIYLADGKPEKALQQLESYIETHPNAHQILIEAGNFHYRAGDYNRAEHYYKQAIRSDPDNAMAHNCLGMIYLNRSIESEARNCFETAIKHDPELLSAHCNLALLQRMKGDYELAEASYDEVLALDPEFEPAISGKAAIYERMGNADKAIELIEPLILAQTTNINALLVYADSCRKPGKERETVDLLVRALNNPLITEAERMQLHFSIGKLLDKLKDYVRAFMHYEHGNKLNSFPFNEDAQVRLTDTTISSFSPGNMANIRRSTNMSRGLLFIVGMPRSGTTLTEQILSSHPDVYGAGELPHIRNIAATIPAAMGLSLSFPLNIAEITQEILDQYSYSHLQNLQLLAHGEKVIIDKMPSNFMFLGLIELLFPNARVLHCVRDPMDTCLSCYFQQFYHGQYFSYDQSDLALYYQQYRKLMNHWKSTLSIPIMDIQYEELVQDTAGKSREILEFVGLGWDPVCSEFYSSNRKVLTASYDQVRRPIYNSSIGRWKKYEKHLSTLQMGLSEFYESVDQAN